jgi:hypothetical protein
MQTNMKVEILDRGTKFMNTDLKGFCQEEGTVRGTSVPPSWSCRTDKLTIKGRNSVRGLACSPPEKARTMMRCKK